MSEPSWKKFERWCAALIGGERYWANSGEKIDVESDGWIGQCKLVKTMSLEQLTQLAESAHADAVKRSKRGAVFIKVRRGRGNVSPALVVMLAGTWKEVEDEAAD